MRKDSLLQCMHVAAAQHRTPSISPISLQCQTKLGFNFVELLWYGRSWPRSKSERGKSNLEWKKNTFILSNYNELVDILSSGMETSCGLKPLAGAGARLRLVNSSHGNLVLVAWGLTSPSPSLSLAWDSRAPLGGENSHSGTDDFKWLFTDETGSLCGLPVWLRIWTVTGACHGSELRACPACSGLWAIGSVSVPHPLHY